MPKHEITIEADKVPAELTQFIKDGKFTFWVGQDGEDIKLAAELNPTLEANRNQILIEKRKIETDYDALKATIGDDTLDKAKVVAENERLKAKVKTDDEVQLLESFKTVFPNMQPSEVKEKLPALVDASTEVEKFRKRDQQELLFNASGFSNKTVFSDLINNPDKMKGIKGDLFVEEVDGKKKLFANVEVSANGTTVTEKKDFFDHAKSMNEWKDYLPALGVAAPDNQYWNPQNPPIHDNPGTKPEWMKRVEESNKQAAAIKPFEPASQVNNQGT